MKEVSLRRLAEYFNLENLTPSISLDGIYIEHEEINRPALQLAGFYKYFDNERIQLVGRVEYAYMGGFTNEERVKIWTELFKRNIPCLVVCRGLPCGEDLIRKAEESRTPLLRTKLPTTIFMGRLIQYLRTVLAPQISMHGVLVDIYGEGVLWGNHL